MGIPEVFAYPTPVGAFIVAVFNGSALSPPVDDAESWLFISVATVAGDVATCGME